jgi:phosphomannomutase
LREKVNVEAIKEAIAMGKLTVFADVMHGAAAGGLAKILELPAAQSNLIEINSDSDPLFGGGAPEPLPRYIAELFRRVKTHHHDYPDKTLVGFIFDGDADRIAATDSEGNFLSSQILIPILLEHLAKNRGFKGELIKTISGSDLMPKVAELFDLPVYETPVGYKYIAERMLSGIPCLLGGEESGGVGYGNHIPERDALLSALYVLEAIATSNKDLSVLYSDLQKQTNFFSHYDRIDKKLSGMAARERLVATLQQFSLTEIAGRKVIDAQAPDGFKFRLEDGSWLLVRFSGTEPLLRLYCEAETSELVQKTLNWISDWAEQFN